MEPDGVQGSGWYFGLDSWGFKREVAKALNFCFSLEEETVQPPLPTQSKSPGGACWIGKILPRLLKDTGVDGAVGDNQNDTAASASTVTGHLLQP